MSCTQTSRFEHHSSRPCPNFGSPWRDSPAQEGPQDASFNMFGLCGRRGVVIEMRQTHMSEGSKD
jgi:hypothetical protein